MLFSQAHGRSVVSVSTAETLGTVAGCVIAPSPARLVAFRLKMRGRGGHVLTWDNIHSIGTDAITVRSADNIHAERDTDLSERVDKSHDPIGKPILSESGESTGKVMDIDFDPETGRLQRLLTIDQEIDGERLLGSGSYAVIVSVRS